ncbi:MAG: hypothetical protein WKG03_03695 [Telluria sp.]
MGVGAALVGFPLVWLYNELGIQLVTLGNGMSGVLPLFSGAVLAIGAGIFAISLYEKKRRRMNPRVFVQTIV